ncbi:hypothetical protein SUGI_0986250 [Cryptomeria japonica]|uniref:uncharacterized protein LOC131038230 n=1 Tax=Cryptomeria japonica TaxID=3369 RepID=UPI0024147AEC|nr:uncharacterized protein LOC131038230 [Cryptomeria japonica]GLJ46764.1 hypothetical protein SUGI_0986250 [Cryptomeria japonica]
MQQANSMEEMRPRCCVQLKLDVVGATLIALQPGSKGSLFVRYYLNKKIAVNTKEVEASPEPHWGETFCLECGGKGMDEILSALIKESESVVFEVRWRRRREIFGGSKSKVLGRLEVSWKELLSSPTLSLSKWFSLEKEGKKDVPLPLLTPALQIAMSVTVAAETVGHKISKCREESRNVSRRLRRLERDECGCGGEMCRADYEGHLFGQV